MSEEELAALREATKRAHEVLKDLRQMVREAKDLVQVIDKAAGVAVEQRVQPAVDQGLEEFSEALKTAIDDGTEAVFKRFDTISDTLLGEDKASRRQGKPSIAELAERRMGQS